MFKMEEQEYWRFMKALESWNRLYDPEEQMIKRPFSSPSYHTTLKGGFVHPTRDSLTYAVALLDSGIEEYRLRAIKILKKVISLQDTDPSHKTYGIWPWFYEEPLDKMLPPDWNWADFCSKELLQVTLDHADRVSADVIDMVKQSVIHAARSIMRRNMGPHYTNIAIMGTYVTLLSGQLFGEDEIFQYGKQRLERIYDYTIYHSAFTEYNSPTYTVVVLEDISRMLNHIKDNDCLNMIKVLNDIGWRCMAYHFHYPTRQWTGPHSRCYSTLQGPPFWSRIQLATGGRAAFLPEDQLEIGIDWPRIRLKCPDKYLHYFMSFDQERTVREIFVKGEGMKPSQLAVSYLTSKYALGTFYQSDLWNQRRALIAYWGTHDRPVHMHLRCLHDGYDYASAILHAVQVEGNVLSMVNFVIDGGDTHCNLDMVKDATIRAKDLRLRLEIGGAIEDVILPQIWGKADTVKCSSSNLAIAINIPYCCFGDFDVCYETGKDKDKACLDVVFYHGPETDICFADLEQAVCAMALSIGPANAQIEVPKADVKEAHGLLKLEWKPKDRLMQIEGRMKPGKFSEIYADTKGYIDGIPVDQSE